MRHMRQCLVIRLLSYSKRLFIQCDHASNWKNRLHFVLYKTICWQHPSYLFEIQLIGDAAFEIVVVSQKSYMNNGRKHFSLFNKYLGASAIDSTLIGLYVLVSE